MILVAGDTHGDIDYRKLDNHKVRSQFGRLPDYLIVAGDFGVPWSNNEEDPTDLFMKKWYEDKPYEIIVVLGNHDNYSRIEKMPQEVYHGARVKRYTSNIVFVEKNQILELENKIIYCFGGADSIDKEYRTLNESWWPQEQSTYADFLEMKNFIFRSYNISVDYVITHTAPEHVVAEMGREDRLNDSTSKLLTYVDLHLKFKHWYFGHMHEDVTIKDKYTCLYEILIRI